MISSLLLILTALTHIMNGVQETPATNGPQEGGLFIVPILAKERQPHLVFIQKNHTVSALDVLRNPAKKFITHAIVLQSEQQIKNFVRTKGSPEDITSIDKIKSGETASHIIQENLQQQRPQFFIGKFNQDVVKTYFNQKNDALHKIITQTPMRDPQEKFILCSTINLLYYAGIKNMLEKTYVQGYHEKNIIEALYNTRVGKIMLYFFNDVVRHYTKPTFTLRQATQYPRIVLDHDVNLHEVLESARCSIGQPYYHLLNQNKQIPFDEAYKIGKQHETIDHAQQELAEGRIPIFVSQ